MLTLHLIRHGQTNFNVERRVQGQFDSVLTADGIEQAKAFAPDVAALGIKSAYSSSNIRASHTAEILTDGLGLTLNIRDDLREIMMGPWQERLYADVIKTHPEQLRQFRDEPHKFKIDGAETVRDVQDRGVKAVEEIIATEIEAGADHVMIVSHGVILKTILTHYAGLPLKDIWVEPHLTNCSHSILKATKDGQCHITQIAGEDISGTEWAA